MRVQIATICALVGCLWASADAAELKAIRVVDGDTLVGEIHLGFDVVLKNQVIRIYAFDAWETTKRRQTIQQSDEAWAIEIVKGERARDDLRKLLDAAERVTVEEAPTKDPYGRVLAYVYADEVYVPNWMKERGHSRN